MNNFLSSVESVNNAVNGFVWGLPMLILLVGTGILMTVLTKCFQVTHFKHWLKNTIGGIFKDSHVTAHTDKEDTQISQFQSLCTALAATIGTGNIAGVAAAILSGGPGAIFWMWIVAFFGASTAFVESTLSQLYKFPHSSGYRGGPFSFIEKGLGKRWLGVLFAIVTIISCGLFLVTVQANGASASMNNAFPVPPLATLWLPSIMVETVPVPPLSTP